MFWASRSRYNLHMKYHATVQTVRELFDSRREKNPSEIVKDFFMTAA